MVAIRRYTYKLEFILSDLNPFRKSQCRYCNEEFKGVWSAHKCIHHKLSAHFMEVMMKEILPMVLITLACVDAVKYLRAARTGIPTGGNT